MKCQATSMSYRVLSCIVLLACQFAGAAIVNAQQAQRIRIGTGGPAGVYFVAGNAICQIVRASAQKSLPTRLHCAAPPSGGSIDNLSKLRAGQVEFAVVQSDWQHHAYHETSRFKGDPHRDLRSVFSLHVEPFQIVARKGSGIRNWNGLQGKRVNIGNIGSGHRATFEDILEAHNQSFLRFKDVQGLASAEHAQALCDGKVDAFAFTVGVPNATIAQATDGCEASIISLDTKAITQLVKTKPFYSWTSIPKGTYFTTETDVKTFGVVATLVTLSSVSERTVYALTKAVFENIERLQRFHPAFAALSVEQMAKSGLSAPLHPGARRYFRERGLLK